MPTPQGVDGVEEDEVTRGNQEEEHPSRTRVHSWKRKRTVAYLKKKKMKAVLF